MDEWGSTLFKSPHQTIHIGGKGHTNNENFNQFFQLTLLTKGVYVLVKRIIFASCKLWYSDGTSMHWHQQKCKSQFFISHVYMLHSCSMKIWELHWFPNLCCIRKLGWCILLLKFNVACLVLCETLQPSQSLLIDNSSMTWFLAIVIWSYGL